MGLGLGGLLKRIQDLERRSTGDHRDTSSRIGGTAPNLGLRPPFGVMFFEAACVTCQASISVVEEHLAGIEPSLRAKFVGVLDGVHDQAPDWWHPTTFGTTASDSVSSQFGIRAFPWAIGVDSSSRIVLDEPLAPRERAIETLRRLSVIVSPHEN